MKIKYIHHDESNGVWCRGCSCLTFAVIQMPHGDMANQRVNLWSDPPIIHNLEIIVWSIENILNQIFSSCSVFCCDLNSSTE
jgi:hypothetical protein